MLHIKKHILEICNVHPFRFCAYMKHFFEKSLSNKELVTDFWTCTKCTSIQHTCKNLKVTLKKSWHMCLKTHYFTRKLPWKLNWHMVPLTSIYHRMTVNLYSYTISISKDEWTQTLSCYCVNSQIIIHKFKCLSLTRAYFWKSGIIFYRNCNTRILIFNKLQSSKATAQPSSFIILNATTIELF